MWQITTVSGTHYLWRITTDAVEYLRFPAEATRAFPEDDQMSWAVCVDWWPAIGGRIYWGSRLGSWWLSSDVVRIKQVSKEVR